jgi:hypothetical protein
MLMQQMQHMSPPNPDPTNLLKSEIFDYVINVLHRYHHYVRFDKKKTKDKFIAHIWKCYNNFNNKTLQEQIRYVNEQLYWGDDDEFTPTMCPIHRMDLCLFYETWSSPPVFMGGWSGVPYEWKVFEDHDDQAKNHWLIRADDGHNLMNSRHHRTWGMKETTLTKGFDYLVKPGDILWFILNGSGGKVIAYAEYVSHNGRTRPNEEFGWERPATNGNDEWNIEVNYTDFRHVETDNLFTRIKGQSANIRIYNHKEPNCEIDLPRIYAMYT